ncbi:MAG: hypothetical protein K6E10_12305, partial [Eubacterium sp.]|nr:hypothetical protein [Eubacterium sp.]
VYPSKIILFLVALYSIISILYILYNSKLSQVLFIGASSPIAFMFFYLILGMILHRNYDYIFYYTENSYPTLVLLGLIVLFVLSFVFFYKMCKITAPGRILYFIPDKIEKVLYKPCVITSFICVLVLIATVLMGSYMNGAFADNIMTIKIVSILSVCLIIFIIEFITSRSVWKGCGIVKNR